MHDQEKLKMIKFGMEGVLQCSTQRNQDLKKEKKKERKKNSSSKTFACKTPANSAPANSYETMFASQNLLAVLISHKPLLSWILRI